MAATTIAPGFVRTGLTARNDFDMPFVIEVEKAAHTIADGLAAGDAETAFPRRMSLAMKAIGRLLPGPLRRRGPTAVRTAPRSRRGTRRS